MLYVCSSCARHVRASDSACPFCGTAATHRTTRVATPARLGRSALLAIAASTSACGGPNCPESTASARPVLVAELDDAGQEINNAPAYGGAPIPIYGTAPPCH